MKCFRIPTVTSRVPGYSELRRHVLIGAPAAIAACLASPNTLLAAIDESQSDAQLEKFIASTNQQASDLKLDHSASGQDTYVEYLANAISDVKQVALGNMSTSTWKDLDPGVFLGTSGRNSAFFIVHWRLHPGAFLPPHCHPKTSVCTLGLAGNATLRHFDTDSTAPSYRNDRESEFLIRETRRLELSAGSISTLTEHRDNIHLFSAGSQGARGIDVTTDYGGDGSFSFLEIDDDRPVERDGKLYTAKWIGTSLS